MEPSSRDRYVDEPVGITARRIHEPTTDHQLTLATDGARAGAWKPQHPRSYIAMNTELLSYYRNLFLSQRHALVRAHEQVPTEMTISTDDLMDEGDLTGAELETSMRARMRNRETLFLKKINEALARIREGSFGLCESCEEPIESKRLEARPTATQCIGCKESSERREHLHIDGHRYKSLG